PNCDTAWRHPSKSSSGRTSSKPRFFVSAIAKEAANSASFIELSAVTSYALKLSEVMLGSLCGVVKADLRFAKRCEQREEAYAVKEPTRHSCPVGEKAQGSFTVKRLASGTTFLTYFSWQACVTYAACLHL